MNMGQELFTIVRTRYTIAKNISSVLQQLLATIAPQTVVGSVSPFFLHKGMAPSLWL